MEMDLMGESMGMYKGTEVRLQGGRQARYEVPLPVTSGRRGLRRGAGGEEPPHAASD